MSPIRRSFQTFVAAAASAVCLDPGVARAERLPLARYTSEQGLAHDSVLCAMQDRQGFVWFGTARGLSRFDGSAFKSFGEKQGLARTSIISLLEEENGKILVGTAEGLYRFDPDSGGSFSRIKAEPPTGRSFVLLQRDQQGSIWAGANGLYRLESGAAGELLRRLPLLPHDIDSTVSALLVDRDGNLWVGTRYLHRVSPGASPLRVCGGIGSGFEWVTSLAQDTLGRVWVATRQGLWLVKGTPVGQGLPSFECQPFPKDDPFRAHGMFLLAGSQGELWTSAIGGEIQALDPEGRTRLRIGVKQGLPTSEGAPLLLDRGGNLWLNTHDLGVVRLRAAGFTSFGPADGLEERRVGSILKSRSGDLVVSSGHRLYKLHESRFLPISPRLPADLLDLGWGWHQYEMEDHAGDWWIPTGEGIYRFRPPKRLEDLPRSRPANVYTEADGLPTSNIFRLFEDSRGDIWICVHNKKYVPGAGENLVRWERATGRFHRYGEDQRVTQSAGPTAFAEDHDGQIWIGCYLGIVYRYREGRFERLFDGQGEIGGRLIAAFHLDRRGRLWIATSGKGVCRVDDPAAEHPAFHCLTAQDGLSSDEVNDIAEDSHGRIYLGTNHGVDVLRDDRVSHHLGTADGLPHPVVTAAYGDPDLGLWFGTLDGLARLDPENAYAQPLPPSVRIDGLRVAGVPRPVSAVGEKAIQGLVLAPDERRLQIDYVGISGELDGSIRFQHRLGPSETWSDPGPERSLLLPSLSPGRYQFEVRAVGTAGAFSPEPAVVSFRLLAPVWRRPWFLGLAAMLLAGLAAAAYRARVSHLLELERQRQRISMDLHDQVGSGLGSIGVLADLAATEGLDPVRRRGLLEQIASTSSELATSMADIVRSLRPGSEGIESFARHLSQRARRMFPGATPALQVRMPPEWPSVRLSLAVRHAVLMVGLEALHNAARHAGASRVILAMEPRGARWRLSVSDDGRGLDREGPPRSEGGTGLEGMRRRAAEIGADLRVESSPGGGTSVTLLFNPGAEKAGGSARA